MFKYTQILRVVYLRRNLIISLCMIIILHVCMLLHKNICVSDFHPIPEYKRTSISSLSMIDMSHRTIICENFAHMYPGLLKPDI